MITITLCILSLLVLYTILRAFLGDQVAFIIVSIVGIGGTLGAILWKWVIKKEKYNDLIRVE